MDEKTDKKKQHRAAQAGRKRERKKDKKHKGEPVVKHNPKAFRFSGGVLATGKKIQKTLDRKAKRERAELINKTPDIPPPFVVVVHGPPGVGKTTLIRSLVKSFTKQNLVSVSGPITLVGAKDRRYTFFECPNDLPGMIDLAKVADLVLCMVDASFGFEMETFEFINIMQTHGFPRVVCVLSHMDSFLKLSGQKKAKKQIKARFWAELYDGAKVQAMSGIEYGRYARKDILGLVRLILNIKYLPLSWRAAHPYILAHRFEDATEATRNTEEDGHQVNFYGYVYGAMLRPNIVMHLPGVGDYNVTAVKNYSDPCPPPEKLGMKQRASATTEERKQNKAAMRLRTLSDKYRLIYAPSSNIGNVVFDADAMYINVAEHKDGFTRKEDFVQPEEDAADDDDGDEGSESSGQDEEGTRLPEAVSMVRQLQQADSVLDGVVRRKTMALIPGMEVEVPVEEVTQGGRTRRRVLERPVEGAERNGGDQDDDEDTDLDAAADEEEFTLLGADAGGQIPGDAALEDDGARGRAEVEKAQARFSAKTLFDLVYGNQPIAAAPTAAVSKSQADPTADKKLALFDEEEDDEASTTAGTDIDAFESCKVPFGTNPGGIFQLDEEARAELKARKFAAGGWDSADEAEKDADMDEGEGAEKPDKDEEGAGEEKDEDEKPGALDEERFVNVFPIGTYVRVTLDKVPAASVEQLNMARPMVLGGCLAGEAKLGMLQMRVKKHRWHKKLLKTNDALLFSAGWRRFQSIPMFCTEDRSGQVRMLKYSPEHKHCMMTAWAPLVHPQTGILCVRNWAPGVAGFRIAATGLVLEASTQFRIVKKLKFVGEPKQIFKKTAFISGMFSSDLEVSKCVHAKLQTVSGIRGEIKKAVGTQGTFRAGFEDKILMSDLVICKAWVQVSPKKFYNPMLDLPEWRRMRTMAELRRDAEVAIPQKADADYGAKPVRAEKVFNELKIGKNLAKNLPFELRPEDRSKRERHELEDKTAVVRSEEEEQVANLLAKLELIKADKLQKKQAKRDIKWAAKRKVEDREQAARDAAMAERRKIRYRNEGQKDAKKQKGLRMRD